MNNSESTNLWMTCFPSSWAQFDDLMAAGRLKVVKIVLPKSGQMLNWKGMMLKSQAYVAYDHVPQYLPRVSRLPGCFQGSVCEQDDGMFVRYCLADHWSCLAVQWRAVHKLARSVPPWQKITVRPDISAVLVWSSQYWLYALSCTCVLWRHLRWEDVGSRQPSLLQLAQEYDHTTWTKQPSMRYCSRDGCKDIVCKATLAIVWRSKTSAPGFECWSSFKYCIPLQPERQMC